MDGVRALVTYGAAAMPRSPVTPEPHGKTGPPRPSGTCIHGDTSISALACRTLLSHDLSQDGCGTCDIASHRPKQQSHGGRAGRPDPRDRTSWIVGFPGAKSGGARLCTLRIAASLAALPRLVRPGKDSSARYRAPAPSTSDSVGRLLAGTSKAIGKRRPPASQRAADQLFTPEHECCFRPDGPFGRDRAIVPRSDHESSQPGVVTG